MLSPLRSSSRSRWLSASSGAVAALATALYGQQTLPAPPSPPAPQMPAVTFRVEVNYVEVDATVLDRQGQFVGDLKPGDFQVLEDGKPQKITNFSLIDIPIERAEKPFFTSRSIEPDVQTNVKSFDGRIYLILLDDLHTAPAHTIWVRDAAKKFIASTLGANDVAAVVSVQGRASQGLTGNKRLLSEAVDRFIGAALDPDQEKLYENLRVFNASRSLDVIHQLCDFMAGVRGRRKALVLFSDGIDYDVQDAINNKGASRVRQDTRDAIGAATRANVSIYAVDPRGLETDDLHLGDRVNSPPPPVGASAAQKLQQESLEVLATETGGFASLNSNDFADAYDRIQQANSRYYVLGYYPTNDRRDGKFRKIEVKLARPDLEVRSRKGYLAPSGKAPAAAVVEVRAGTPPVLREALGSLMPLAGVRLTATAAAFKGKAGKASVTLVVQTDGPDLQFKQKDGRYEDTVDLAVVAIDERGRTVKGGLHHSIALPLLPASYEEVMETGLRVTSKLDLPPGRYQVRIAAADRNSQRAGSVNYDLEVPKFEAGSLTMSHLLLTSSLADRVRTAVAEPNDEILKVLPGPPTATRDFKVGEELALVAEVYDNDLKTPHKVDIVTTVQADDGRQVFKQADERASNGYTARVPLQGLAPGLYVLKVEAHSRAGNGKPVSREVQFKIVP